MIVKVDGKSMIVELIVSKKKSVSKQIQHIVNYWYFN